MGAWLHRTLENTAFETAGSPLRHMPRRVRRSDYQFFAIAMSRQWLDLRKDRVRSISPFSDRYLLPRGRLRYVQQEIDTFKISAACAGACRCRWRAWRERIASYGAAGVFAARRLHAANAKRSTAA